MWPRTRGQSCSADGLWKPHHLPGDVRTLACTWLPGVSPGTVLQAAVPSQAHQPPVYHLPPSLHLSLLPTDQGASWWTVYHELFSLGRCQGGPMQHTHRGWCCIYHDIPEKCCPWEGGPRKNWWMVEMDECSCRKENFLLFCPQNQVPPDMSM